MNLLPLCPHVKYDIKSMPRVTTGEILALAGCDKLTIAPSLLGELRASTEPLLAALSPDRAHELYPGDRLAVDEKAFRWAMNQDAMATEKLAEGIRNFAADIVKLENIVGDRLRAAGNV